MIKKDSSVLGEWRLNTFNCVDAIEGLASIPSESVDIVVTDPPFGIDLQPARKKTEAIANDKKDDAVELWRLFVPEIYRVMKPNTAAMIHVDRTAAWSIILVEQYFQIKGAVAWVKNNFGAGRYFRNQWEKILYIHKGAPPTPDIFTSNVWFEDRIQAPIHSCQKPIGLMIRSIKLCGGRGIVLDPFAGVASTLIAARQLKCDFLGFEIEEKYVSVGRKRLAGEHGATLDERWNNGVPATFMDLGEMPGGPDTFN